MQHLAESLVGVDGLERPRDGVEPRSARCLERAEGGRHLVEVDRGGHGADVLGDEVLGLVRRRVFGEPGGHQGEREPGVPCARHRAVFSGESLDRRRHDTLIRDQQRHEVGAAEL